ncbi:MAG: hypothetical protein IPJ86_04230 [Bacteroidetes bacterium]|nr:hypothetical protein [Bacteroidota bacterium]
MIEPFGLAELMVQISESDGSSSLNPAFFAGMNAETDFNPEEWVSWVLEHENEDTSSLALRYAGKKIYP